MYTVFGKQPTKQDKTCAANTLFRMNLSGVQRYIILLSSANILRKLFLFTVRYIPILHSNSKSEQDVRQEMLLCEGEAEADIVVAVHATVE